MPFLLLFTSFNALPSSITLKSVHASIFYFSKSFVFGVFSPFLSTCGKDYLLSPLVYYVVEKKDIYVFQGHLYTIEEENK